MAIKPSVTQMSTDPDFSPWAKQGWTLVYGPTVGGRIQAVNEQARYATDGAKRLPTLLKRLQKGECSHYWYTCHQQYTRRLSDNPPLATRVSL